VLARMTIWLVSVVSEMLEVIESVQVECLLSDSLSRKPVSCRVCCILCAVPCASGTRMTASC
jgi:hypothetical protein